MYELLIVMYVVWCDFSARWMERTYREPAMRRQWRPFALPKTPLWSRCSDGNHCLWVKGHLRMSSWWMCARRQTSPLSTSWLLPNSGLAAHLCQTFALSCSQTGKNCWLRAKMEYSLPSASTRDLQAVYQAWTSFLISIPSKFVMKSLQCTCF